MLNQDFCPTVFTNLKKIIFQFSEKGNMEEQLNVRIQSLKRIVNKQDEFYMFQDRRVVLNNPEWNKQHNYKGVYDMIFNEGRLCASVYDTIQIWDTQVECYCN